MVFFLAQLLTPLGVHFEDFAVWDAIPLLGEIQNVGPFQKHALILRYRASDVLVYAAAFLFAAALALAALLRIASGPPWTSRNCAHTDQIPKACG